ncbi:MAG: D-amino acid dehydrogenase [Achromobacter sp.]
MRVVVLGSGVIGVSTAWWLSRAGHDVTVIDRRSGPAQETSFANGGQISVSYAEPWASPGAPLKLLRWMMRDDAPMVFRPRLDARQWAWGVQFLRECLPGRFEPNLRAMVRLSEYSRSTLRAMRSELGLEYDQVQRGILHFYRDAAAFEASQRGGGIMRDLGIDRRVVSPDEVVALEPALGPHRASIVGGDFTPDDESGDVHKFTVALADHCTRAGVDFQYDTQITRLIPEGGQIRAVETIDAQGAFGSREADAFVVAMGVGSPALVKPLGLRVPVYPAKGYSLTLPVRHGALAPTVSLSDSSHKLVMSRFGDRFRLAGTAELSGYSRALDERRCASMLNYARTLFPDAFNVEDVRYWSGLRPTTPSNVPLIGRTRIANLYLNTGHGTLGWTMGAGSGRALADLLSGRRPEPEFPFLGL